MGKGEFIFEIISMAKPSKSFTGVLTRSSVNRRSEQGRTPSFSKSSSRHAKLPK